MLECDQVALAWEQQPGAAVVPNRARLFAAVAGLDLGQIVKAEKQLDALAGSARRVAGKARNTGEVGSLIERQEQARREHATLRARPECGLPQQGGDESREERPAALGLFGGRDQIERAASREQVIEA